VDGRAGQVQRDERRSGGGHEQEWRERFERDHRLRSALGALMVPPSGVDVVAYGEAGAAVLGTGGGILVYKRGIKAGLPFGGRLKPFEFESVVAVNLRRYRGGAVLAVHAPLKVGSCPVYWLDERDDPWRARNALVVADLDVEPFEEVATALRALMAAHRERHGRATPAPRPRIEKVPEPSGPACAACGAAVVAGWHYCPECGAPFERAAERLTRPRAGHG
jgi:hypothetical protein